MNEALYTWLQFEADVSPIQVGWGTRLAELAEENMACAKWWQMEGHVRK
jgi:hypothetical protein